MTARLDARNGGNGSGPAMRAGARVLGLLADPLNATVLRALSSRATRPIELRGACGSPPQTTLRSHARELEAAGAIAKRRRSGFPSALEYELEPAGRDLLLVVDVLERWLRAAPRGPLRFDDRDAKAAIAALADGWSSTMLRALAARPCSLTELDVVIGDCSYLSLERRLKAMRLNGQVEACPVTGNGTPYRVSDWLRRGAAPLAVAAFWERQHMPDETSPLTRLDTEALFLLTLPLVRVPAELSGTCRLGVEMSRGAKRSLVGAMVHIDAGRLASCSVRLRSAADAWVTGTTSAWLRALVESDRDGLELGGRQELAGTLLENLRGALFGGAALSLRP